MTRLTIVLPEQLRYAQAPQLQHSYQQQLQTGSFVEVVIDAAKLTNFDTSAIALLLDCLRLAKAAKASCSIQQASPALQVLARIGGVEQLLFPAAVV